MRLRLAAWLGLCLALAACSSTAGEGRRFSGAYGGISGGTATGGR